MKKTLPLALLGLLFTACSQDDAPTHLKDGIPVVQSFQTYDIIFEEDIIYAEGLVHENVNCSTIIPLKLDVYAPDNDSENRPAFMFVHGGGFAIGSKQQSQVVDLANYYTSRGWVFISIDYRLRDQNGTVPQEWSDFSNLLPEGQAHSFRSIYPAQRDAKAALRWMVAHADAYNINTDYITIGGGSAGAMTAIAAGVSNPEDFRDEIDDSIDPTTTSTNLNQTYTIQTIIDLWGSDRALEALQDVYGHQRFDSDNPPLFIAHGTADAIVPFAEAENIRDIYEANGVPFAFYPLQGLGHSAWNAIVDNKPLSELVFDFIVEQQNITVE